MPRALPSSKQGRQRGGEGERESTSIKTTRPTTKLQPVNGEDIDDRPSNKRALVAVFVCVLMFMALPSLHFSAMLTNHSAELKFFEKDYLASIIFSNPNATSDTQEANKPMVAVVVCTKSSNTWTSVNSTTVHKLFIPSVERTVTLGERNNFRLHLVLGFDTNDAFWENEKNRIDLQATTNIPINFISIPKNPSRPHQIPFNQACRAAYDYGADYIARMNDDSEFITRQWITKGVARLAQFDPPNVGVVGPTCRQGNTAILTHDFVHRTHLDIFRDQYYPNEFDNWWIDDWITYVYGEKRTLKLPEWQVVHHVGKHGQRYNVNATLQRRLEMTLERGRVQIDNYLQNLDERAATTGSVAVAADTTGSYQVLGTNRVTAVWGPMTEAHQKMLVASGQK